MRRFVIVVGDAAAWLGALTLEAAGAGDVTVVELPGRLREADIYPSLPALAAFHRRLGIDEARLLRAVRFAARLQFNIEPGTRAAMRELQQRIELISRERIGEEIRMMLEHPSRGRAMALLRLDRIEGADLTVDGRPVRVERPAWIADA